MEITDKTSHKALKEYVKSNNLQDAYLAKYKKAYTKATKYELLTFIKEHLNIKEIENNMEAIFSDNNGDQILKGTTTTIEIKEEHPDLNELCAPEKVESDEIEEIPIFKESRRIESQIAGFSFDKEEKYLRLNNAQYKVKAYIARFPEKTRNITSRPTFKKEFANLRDALSKKERDELAAKGLSEEDINKQSDEGQLLLEEVENTLSSKSCAGLAKDGVLTTIGVIENILRSIRENKDNKFPAILVSTLGQVNISGLSAVLDAKQEFHDCVDELLIKYSDYDSLFMALSAEKRLCLIILTAAFVTHTINTEQETLLKMKKIDPRDPKLKGL